jgi:hypothetical protein
MYDVAAEQRLQVWISMGNHVSEARVCIVFLCPLLSIALIIYPPAVRFE